MIIDITNEVYTNIKNQLTPVTVLSTYPSTPPSFPCIIIEEMSNISIGSTIDTAGEHYNEVTLEVNIFSDSQYKVSEVKDLRNRIDSILSDQYKMGRDYSGTIPNFLDSNIYRYVLRYSFIIDENKRIYRR